MFFWKHVSEVHFSSKREQNLPRLLMEQLQCQLVVGPGKQGSEFEFYQFLSNLGKDILPGPPSPKPFPVFRLAGPGPLDNLHNSFPKLCAPDFLFSGGLFLHGFIEVEIPRYKVQLF